MESKQNFIKDIKKTNTLGPQITSSYTNTTASMGMS